ncbi:MAG TPA: hypothetical protein VIL49_04850, partial [Capillimicrobium sp.]
RALAPALAAAVLAAGCGDDGPGPPTAAKPATAAVPTQPPPPRALTEALPESPPAGAGGAAAPAPEPPGPPRVPFRRGDGAPVGGLVRSAYTAQAFAPLPAGFRRGPIPAGSRAGPCTVRQPAARDLRQLRRLAASLHPGDTLQGIYDENLLLAGCGRRGEHGLLLWTRISPERDRTSELIEVVRRRGAWTQRRNGTGPGCTLPRAAASAFRIDVSPCRRGG